AQDAAQDAVVRNGRNVPGAGAEEDQRAGMSAGAAGGSARATALLGDRRIGEDSLKNEKGPGKPGPWSGSCLLQPCYSGRSGLLLFLRSSLLLRGGFLGCALHRLILPNIRFCDLENRNVIHI